MGKLDNAVAIITGASQGQGAAIARLFVAEGASVVLGDIADPQGAALAEELGAAALYTHLDVANPDDWTDIVSKSLGQFGRITILVNNAGILDRTPILEATLENYLHVINVNQVGCWLGMKAVAPEIASAGGGAIVNTSSIAGLHGIAGRSAYVSSKFAVRGMTKVAALEFGASNIRVNSVHPGSIETGMALASKTYEDQAISRIGQPEEVAKMVLFLSCDDSSYCTGSEFTIDGGRLAGSYPGGRS